MKTIKTTADLRDMLVSCINDVRSKKIDVKQGRVISALAAQIINSANLDLQFARQLESKGSKVRLPGKSPHPVLLGK